MAIHESRVSQRDDRKAVQGPERFDVLRERAAFRQRFISATSSFAHWSASIQKLRDADRTSSNHRVGLVLASLTGMGRRTFHRKRSKGYQLEGRPTRKTLAAMREEAVELRRDLFEVGEELVEFIKELDALNELARDKRLFSFTRFPHGDPDKEQNEWLAGRPAKTLRHMGVKLHRESY